MTTQPQRSWEEIVEMHKGKLFFAPEKFHEKIREWNENRLKLAELANAAAKHELETRLMMENMVYDIRTFLAQEGGVANVWLADVGIEVSALNEGKFVLTVENAAGKNA